MSSNKTILLIGSCGSGKTWVATSIIKELNTINCKLGMIHFCMDEQKQVAILGKYDGSTFQGSDRLSMAVMRDCERLAKFQAAKQIRIIAEGDRFTNRNFIAIMKPIIIKILDDGSNGRTIRGSTQTERQIKSIQSRVSNIVAHYNVANSTEALELIKNIYKL